MQSEKLYKKLQNNNKIQVVRLWVENLMWRYWKISPQIAHSRILSGSCHRYNAKYVSRVSTLQRRIQERFYSLLHYFWSCYSSYFYENLSTPAIYTTETTQARDFGSNYLMKIEYEKNLVLLFFCFSSEFFVPFVYENKVALTEMYMCGKSTT